jgi:uncharacterized membrane protein
MNLFSFRSALLLFGIVGTESQAQAVAYKATLLHPPGMQQSYAHGVSGTSQVGIGLGPAMGGYSHAFLWNGTADNVVDLNPAGFDLSYALGVSGNRQVGIGYGPATSNIIHALMWSGTASSAADLHRQGS